MIALILSFFLLLISTTSNIKENVWEFGVLRAMGLTKSQSKRVYMYEAFAVIFGALILGIMVGLVVSITLTAQFYLFIELPFKLSVRLKNCIIDIFIVPNNALCNYDCNESHNNLFCSTVPSERCQQQMYSYCFKGFCLREIILI
jgi:predicted lysophospholipase L1 biosynthesis ABC-type transport system permease subunit